MAIREWFGIQSTRTPDHLRQEPAAAPANSRGSGLPASLIPYRSDIGGTETDLLGLPTLFRCVALLTTTATSLPLRAYQNRLPAVMPEWLRRPETFNGGIRLRALVEHLVISQALRGAGYLHATPVGSGDAWDLQPVDSRRVTVTLMGDQRSYALDGKPVDIARRYATRPNRPGLVVAPYLTVPGRPDYLGPISAARTALGGFVRTDQYGLSVLDTGTYSGGRLESDLDLPPATAERYQEAWAAAQAVDPADRRIPVLGSGLRYVNDLIDPADAQWLEARGYNATEIARLFGIPPRYLGLPSGDSTTYATARDNDAAFLRYGVAAYTAPIEDAFDALTPPGRGAEDELRIRFDFDANLRPTPADRADYYGKALQAGWLTVDEIRAAENLPPIERSADANAE